jgi:hypothetical protein
MLSALVGPRRPARAAPLQAGWLLGEVTRLAEPAVRQTLQSGRIRLPAALHARQLAARGGERIGILWLIDRGHYGDQRSNSEQKGPRTH